MLSANSAKAYGHLKASALSKLYGQAAITHSARGCGATGWLGVLTHRQANGHGTPPGCNRRPAPPRDLKNAHVPDPLLAAPRLAEIYDVLEGERDDLDHYLAMAAELGARVLDVGCGTGTFACRLAHVWFAAP